MNIDIACECGQRLTTSHERCPYCARPVHRVWYYESGATKSAISTMIDGQRAYVTDDGPLLASDPAIPAALQRVPSTADAMRSVTGSVAPSFGGTLIHTAKRHRVVILIAAAFALDGALRLARSLETLGVSWTSLVAGDAKDVFLLLFLLATVLTIPVVVFGGGGLVTALYTGGLARSKQPSKWDDWLT